MRRLVLGMLVLTCVLGWTLPAMAEAGEPVPCGQGQTCPLGDPGTGGGGVPW